MKLDLQNVKLHFDFIFLQKIIGENFQVKDITFPGSFCEIMNIFYIPIIDILLGEKLGRFPSFASVYQELTEFWNVENFVVYNDFSGGRICIVE